MSVKAVMESSGTYAGLAMAPKFSGRSVTVVSAAVPSGTWAGSTSIPDSEKGVAGFLDLVLFLSLVLAESLNLFNAMLFMNLSLNLSLYLLAALSLDLPGIDCTILVPTSSSQYLRTGMGLYIPFSLKRSKLGACAFP